MSPNHRLRRTLPVFLLLAALLSMSLPIQAAAAHHSSAVIRKVTAVGEGVLSWLRNLFSGLGIAKEGMSIDPDGKPKPDTSSDEGVSIDPNG